MNRVLSCRSRIRLSLMFLGLIVGGLVAERLWRESEESYYYVYCEWSGKSGIVLIDSGGAELRQTSGLGVLRERGDNLLDSP